MLIDEFLKIFFDTLNINNIGYCVLRNFESLPNSLDGSDLDILIAKNDVPHFYNLLGQVLEKSNGKILTKYGKFAPRVCIAGGKKGKWYGIQLDVHEGILPYKSSAMFCADFMLKRAIQHKNIWVANNDDAAFVAFLKQIFYNENYKKEHLLEAKKAWTKYQEEYEITLQKFYSDEYIRMLGELLKVDNSNPNIKKLVKYGRANLTRGLKVKFENLKSKLNKIHRFFRPVGFSIVFLGTDGSGKTTIISEIWKPLDEAVHSNIHYEHFRPNLLPSIAKLFGRENEGSLPVTNPHQGKPSGFIGSLIRLFYYSMDYIFGYLLKIYPLLVKSSSIWIFDRYYYDYLIDPKRARINLPAGIVKFVEIFIPKANLIICLGTDARVIHKRKPELPLENVRQQVHALKKFQENEKRAVWIDTGQSLGMSVDDVLNIVIHTMAERYSDTQCLHALSTGQSNIQRQSHGNST